MTAPTRSASQFWRTAGFEAFASGTFGNAGQNLYCSRAGVLQRVHLYDVNRDGHIDLLFCNAQIHWERPPSFVYHDVLGRCERRELPSAGAAAGAVGDLTGRGWDDLVLANEKSGEAGLRNAFIYFGGEGGLGEHRDMHLPAHAATAVAMGDFNGDGRADLAFFAMKKLRIFYQDKIGFEPKRFVDLDVTGVQVGAADFDGDGFADLYVLRGDEPPRVYWGGPDGLRVDRFSDLEVGGDFTCASAGGESGLSEEEAVGAVSPIAKVVDLRGRPHLPVYRSEAVWLVPVRGDRSFGEPLRFACPHTMSVAAGDVTGNGHADLVFVGSGAESGGQCAWIYWGDADGFEGGRRTAIPTHEACDAVIADLDGNGHGDVIICQHRTDRSFTTESLVLRGSPGGVSHEPVRLPSLGARRVFAVRTCDEPNLQLVFVNMRARNAVGDVDSHIYLGGPDGFDAKRNIALPGRGTSSAVICDLDDDGQPDVILANSSENAQHLDPGSYVFFGRNGSLGPEPDKVLPTRRAWKVAVADLNRNGYLDVVFAHYVHDAVTIFHGGPDGLDVQQPTVLHVKEGDERPIYPRKIFLADLDGDGWLDLVLAPAGMNRCVILWGSAQGFDERRRLVLPTYGMAGTPLARDLNGNGWLDLILGGGKAVMNVPHDSFVQIFWNGPEGLSADRQTQLPSNAAIGMSIADFNGDGHPDIFVANYKSVIERDVDSYLYWGAEGGRYQASRCTRIRTHSAGGCFAADFDEDGRIDLAVANHKTHGDHLGESWVLWNGPDGLDTNNPTRLPTAGPHAMLHVQPGNILTGGDEEFYTSAPFELPEGLRVRRMTWEAELPPKTWVRAQLRFATRRGDLDQAAWMGVSGRDSWVECGAQVDFGIGPWVQYRLALGAVNSGNTPRVSQVDVEYG